MSNLMDSIQFQTAPLNAQNNSIYDLVNRAKQNPQEFEDYVKRTNPQAYQRALAIRGSTNPQAVIMQMTQSAGLNPNILRMLGL